MNFLKRKIIPFENQFHARQLNKISRELRGLFILSESIFDRESNEQKKKKEKRRTFERRFLRERVEGEREREKFCKHKCLLRFDIP